ncbi:MULTISPECIES: phage tail assembly chaperone [Pseudomonas]|uniref:phage tail assembly chaperone n=1 Tax=Pseudomonas TaxID=286 RepID=UPI001BE50276|nr:MULTISPECIES: phage tail assembly chaperone [Pseudomonas]MBT2339456.1 phage tail protein [Pseudomonas fluorescens]MCD4529336.1 phage tail assembly chaperone [Pseudomonas sp. C3-2018]
MLRLYSATTGCTYLETIHPDAPQDAVPITEERFLEVIANPAPGKVRSHDDQGLPILIDPPPPTAEELALAERQWRDAEIESVRWLRERHRDEIDSERPTTLTVAQSGELLDYVQVLRDWPLSPDFPDSACRPVEPPWVAEHNRRPTRHRTL